MCCAIAAYQLKAQLGAPRQQTCPNADQIRSFLDENGVEAADREFGYTHEYLDIKPVGHQQFTTCIVAKNGVLGNNTLLDSTLETDAFVLLKVVEGRDAGYGLNSKGVRVPKTVVDRLYAFINSQPRDRNGKPVTHPDCSVIRSEKQVKDAKLSSSDIKRCTNQGCVFNFSAEAIVRICRMHGIPISSESIIFAFMLQVDLEMRRRAFEGARDVANTAFLELLEADYQLIDLVGCLESMLTKFFTTARSSRAIRQSIESDGLNPEVSTVSTVNNWLVDNGLETKSTLRECLDTILSNSELAVVFNTFIKKIFHKISLKAHPDKTVSMRNPAEKALLESIFIDATQICMDIRKFLFTGAEDDPLVSFADLDRYRHVYARSLTSLRAVNEAREANLRRLANCAWAELLREERVSETNPEPVTSSTELVTWTEMSTALREYVAPEVLSGIESAHAIAPNVVEALVVATVEARETGDESGVAELELLRLAATAETNRGELVEMKGCTGALVATSFPEVHNALYPKIGESVPELSEEQSRLLTLARSVEGGVKGETGIDKMDEDRKETEEEMNVDADSATESYSRVQNAINSTQKKMSVCLTKYANKVFGLLKRDCPQKENEESFVACLELFKSFAYDEISSLISKWTKSPTRSEEFIGETRARFVAALSGFSYDARAFFMVEDKIKSTLTTIQNRNMVKVGGSGRRACRSSVATFDKYALPSASAISGAMLKAKVPVFTVRSSALQHLKKDCRESQLLHGYKFKVRETFFEQGTGTELSSILIFNTHASENASEESVSAAAGGSIGGRDYVLIDYRSISEDGSSCLPFGMKQTLPLADVPVPIANTRGVKRNGRVIFEDNDGYRVTGRNKTSASKRSSRYGSTGCEISKLKSFVDDRHNGGQILPLVGVVENDIVVEIWSGNEPEYQKILNKVLRANNCIIFGCTEDIPTVYSISMQRKDQSSSQSSRFVTRSDEKSAVNADELAEIKTFITPQDELKREFKALSRRDLDEDDIVERARLQWLEERIANPVDDSESYSRGLILSTLESKISFDNQTRSEIVQAVKIGFGEWIHPSEMIAVDMDREAMISTLDSFKNAILFAFNNNISLYQKMLSALERFYSVPATLYEQDEEGELVVKSIETNNFTPVHESKSFYKTINPSHGTVSNGRVKY